MPLWNESTSILSLYTMFLPKHACAMKPEVLISWSLEIDYSRAPCLGADQKTRGLWERDWISAVKIPCPQSSPQRPTADRGAGELWARNCYLSNLVPRVYVPLGQRSGFPFRWTRVTKALGTRLLSGPIGPI